jgi:hypothetical protein
MKLILFITKSYSKGLKRNIIDVGVEKMTLFDFLIRFWHFKQEYIILEMSYCLAFLFGLYLNKTLKICSIDLNHSSTYQPIHTYLPFIV